MLSALRREVTLAERHIKVLNLVRKNQPIGIIRLAQLSGMPMHHVRYSLRVLEHSGIIKPSPKGAITAQKSERFLKTLPKELLELAEKTLNLAKVMG